MKVKDFLREVFEKGNIRDNDLEAALSASGLSEVEIPDTIKDKFNENYLTRDRAENDPNIIEKIGKSKSREIFGNVDSRINSLLQFVDDETKSKIEKSFETYKKLDFLKEGIEEGIKKHQAKKGSEDIRKVEEDWSNKLKDQNQKHEAEKAELLNNFKQTSLKTALKLKIKDFKFGEAYVPLMDVLSNSIIEKVRLERINDKPIELEEADGVVHVRQNVDGALRDVFDKDQNRVTIDSLLTKHVEPFIVKSNGGNNNQNNGNNGQNGKQKPKLPANATLHEMMAAQT